MSTEPSMIARSYALLARWRDIAFNRDNPGLLTPEGTSANLVPQDISYAADIGRLCLQWEPVAGLPHHYGDCASEAAMLALHAPDTITPRYVLRGDTCRRTDLPGAPLMLCIAGNGLTAADWLAPGNYQPAGSYQAAGSYQPLSAELTALAAVSGTAYGRSLLTLANAAALAEAAAAGSGGWTPSDTGPEAPAPVELEWSFNGDTAGLVYFAGTKGGTVPFANPSADASVRLLRSSNAAGAPENLTNRSAEATYTADAAGSWAAIDLGDYAMIPRSYSLQHLTPYALDYIRTWVLQGTNAIETWDAAGVAAATWTDLDTRTSDTTIASPGAWGHWYIPGTPTTYYRYLRLLQTGANSSGRGYLAISEWEFYGTLQGVQAQLPALARGWLKDGSDRFVPYY